MDRFQALRTFIRVAETKSFSRAAESLGLTKASVSTAIREIEEDLGVRLFFRTTRRVQVTNEGDLFYEKCRNLLGDLEEARTMFKEGTLKGPVRVDMPTPLANNIVIPRLPAFTQEYPEVEFEISATDRQVDVIKEGFDCVIRVGTMAESGLVAKKIAAMSMVNCVSAGYLTTHGRPRNLEDLSKHKLVHYVRSLGAKPDGFEYFDGSDYRSVPMRGTLTVNDTNAYQAACLAGYGIIQVPRIGAKELLESGALVEVLQKYRARPMPLALVYPHRKHTAKRVQVFTSWLEKVLKTHLGGR